MPFPLTQRRYTLEEYFELERNSDEKYEFWDGEIFAMSGASPAHVQIQVNLLTSLRSQLRGRSCRVFSSDLRLKVPSLPPYRYADVVALCGEPLFERIGGIETLTNPDLIIEILSPTTEAFDRGDKFTYYKSIASFCEYLLVAQHRPHCTHYVKQQGSLWHYQEVNALTDVLYLPTLECSLDMAEVYSDVTFRSENDFWE